MDIRDYPELNDWSPVDAALDEAARRRFLPVPVEQRLPVLPGHQAALLDAAPPCDPWPARLVAAGGCVALSGGGVWLAGAGVRAAGPYLWALAAALGALAGLVALLKSHGASSSGNTTITVERSRNVRIGR